ncbi:MAG: hypothetical protein ABSB79_10155 [Syntrophales bacterium]|jgi:hypothetical protein
MAEDAVFSEKFPVDDEMGQVAGHSREIIGQSSRKIEAKEKQGSAISGKGMIVIAHKVWVHPLWRPTIGRSARKPIMAESLYTSLVRKKCPQ